MGEAKISGFMYGLLLASFCGIAILLFVGDASENYNSDYDSATMSEMDQLTELNDLAEDIKDSTDIEEKTGLLDIIGGYFSAAYQSLRLAAKSINIFDTMFDSAIENSMLGIIGHYLYVTIIAIVIISIFVGVLIYAMTKVKV